MNESEPMFHPRRHQVRPGPADAAALADQTTARLNALNETLKILSADAANPHLQSKDERKNRRKLRGDVYEEIARLVGPADLITIAKPEMIKAFEGVERRAAESEEAIGGAHAGL